MISLFVVVIGCFLLAISYLLIPDAVNTILSMSPYIVGYLSLISGFCIVVLGILFLLIRRTLIGLINSLKELVILAS